MDDFFGEPIADMSVIEKLKGKFIDEQYPDKILMSNHLKEKPQVRSFEELNNMKLPKEFYYYNERAKLLFKISNENFFKYINQLEPWDEIDGLIFNDNLQWLIVVNHENLLLTIGI